jgi:hypothetical protein
MTTRYLILTPALILAASSWACTGPGDNLALQGVVRDSVTTQPVRHALVYVGEDSTETEDDGTFSMTVPGGRHLVRVVTGRHEPFEREFTIDDDRDLTLLLLRYGAYVQNVSIGGNGTVTATIKDLRDGSTILQGPQTWLIYYSPTIIQSSAIFSSEWDWERLDALSWRVTVQASDPGITGVTWLISDDNLPAYFDCNLTGECTEN